MIAKELNSTYSSVKSQTNEIYKKMQTSGVQKTINKIIELSSKTE